MIEFTDVSVLKLELDVAASNESTRSIRMVLAKW